MTALQMFVEQPRELDMARLTVLGWLVERRLERGPAGAPSGELAIRAIQPTSEPVRLKAA